MRHWLNFFFMAIWMVSCGSPVDNSVNEANYDQRKADSLGIPEGNKLSAAMKRAMQWPQLDNSWFFEYKMMPLQGDLAYEEGVVRRDPSAVLKIGDIYYVWYSKSYGRLRDFLVI